MVQVVRFDPALDERPQQRAKRLDVVVHPAQQHGLRQHRDAGVDQAARRPRAPLGTARADDWRAARRSSLFLVVRSARTSAAETRSGAATGMRVWTRSTLTWPIGGKRIDHGVEPARRKHERIAAGQNDLPDLRGGADVIERGGERARRQRSPARPDHLAAEAEAAIDRAGVDELEQHPVGIAVHDAFDRAERIVADRIAAFPRLRLQLARIGYELPRDRIVRVGAVDQVGDRRRDGDGVTRRDRLPAPRAARGRRSPPRPTRPGCATIFHGRRFMAASLQAIMALMLEATLGKQALGKQAGHCYGEARFGARLRRSRAVRTVR